MVTDVALYGVGDFADIMNVVTKLTEFDYTRVDRIERTGEFTQRGDIIDVWGYGYDNVVRLMFLDDEIEAIKLIDVNNFATRAAVNLCEILPMTDPVVTDFEFTLDVDVYSEPGEFQIPEIGELVYHDSHGLAKYAGIKSLDLGGVIKEYIVLEYGKKSFVYVPTSQTDLLYNYFGTTKRLDRI